VSRVSFDYLRPDHLQSASGNWFADVLRHAYNDALCMKTGGDSDGVLICGGTLRGDSVYGPGTTLSPNPKAMGSLQAAGEITLGDIMEILPFEDPIVVIEIDGDTLWSALEGALETWPAQEGCAPSHFCCWSICSYATQEVPDCIRVSYYMGLFKAEGPTGSRHTPRA